MPVQIGAKTLNFSDSTGLLSDCHRRIEMFLGVLEAAAAVIDRPASEETGRALKSALRYFGQAAPKHTADEDSVIFPLAARLLPQAEKMAIAGEMASMSAHQPHSLRALTGFKMLLRMIRS